MAVYRTNNPISICQISEMHQCINDQKKTTSYRLTKHTKDNQIVGFAQVVPRQMGKKNASLDSPNGSCSIGKLEVTWNNPPDLVGTTLPPQNQRRAMALSSPLRSPIHCWKRVGCRSRSSSSCSGIIKSSGKKRWRYGEHIPETSAQMEKYGNKGWPSTKRAEHVDDLPQKEHGHSPWLLMHRHLPDQLIFSMSMEGQFHFVV